MSYPDVPETSPTMDILVGGGLGVLSGLPFVGGALSGGIQASLQARQRQIDEEFFAFLAARVSRLESEAGSRFDPLDSDFVAAVNKVRRVAHETSDRDKQRLLAEAVADAGSWSRFPLDQRERFMDLIIRLTPWHVRVLVFFRDPAVWLRERGKDVRRVQGQIVMGTVYELIQGQVVEGDQGLLDRVVAIVADLEREGLADIPLRSMMSAAGVFASRTTPSGNRLLDFLGDAATEPLEKSSFVDEAQDAADDSRESEVH